MDERVSEDIPESLKDVVSLRINVQDFDDGTLCYCKSLLSVNRNLDTFYIAAASMAEEAVFSSLLDFIFDCNFFDLIPGRHGKTALCTRASGPDGKAGI